MLLEEAIVAAYKLGIVLLLAKLLEGAFRRFGLPGLAGSISAGLILGPSILGFVDVRSSPYMTLFVMLGLDFLLFLAGAEELGELSWRKIGPAELTLGFTLFSSSALLVSLVLLTIVSPLQAIIVGVVMGMVSVGPMTKSLVESGFARRSPISSLLIAGLVAEVTGIVIFGVLVKGPSAQSLTAALLMLMGVLAFGRWILIRALRVVERVLHSRETTFAIIVALVLLTGYLAHSLGLNSAIVALLLGVFSSTYLAERPECLEKLHAFTYGFFEPLFFAGIGLYVSSISPSIATMAIALATLSAIPKLAVGRAFLNSLRVATTMTAKGGVDAALLLAVTVSESPRVGNNMYAAGVLAITVLAILSAFPIHISGKRAPEVMLNAGDLIVKASINIGDRAERAVHILSKLPALVVIDEEGRPAGVMRPIDLLKAGPHDGVVDVYQPYVTSVHRDKPIGEILSDESLGSSPVLAVVDDHGRVIGALFPHLLLGRLKGRRII